IKAAQYHQLTLSSCTINEIISLFRKNRGKTKNVHYRNKDYRILEKLTKYALDLHKLDIVGAKDQNGKLLAGALFLKDRDRTWFWFSGRDNRYAEGRAMFFIVDEYIKMHDKQELVLDFNGSMNENVARFYKGFGAEKYSYPMVCYTRRFYLSKLIQLYKNIMK
ncbi:MAG: GNAT family N-acetyltransferase, partial [Bacteroidales bacterium]